MEPWQMIVLTALINGAVTWGVIRTELKYLRRDVDLAHLRLDRLVDDGRRA